MIIGNELIKPLVTTTRAHHDSISLELKYHSLRAYQIN